MLPDTRLEPRPVLRFQQNFQRPVELDSSLLEVADLEFTQTGLEVGLRCSDELCLRVDGRRDRSRQLRQDCRRRRSYGALWRLNPRRSGSTEHPHGQKSG